MNENLETSLTEKIAASKAGREVSPDVALSAVRWALARYAPKEAEKAAKARLHQLYGSYVGEGWCKEARRILSALEQGELPPQVSARKLLALHSSTKERLAQIDDCYTRIFTACGRPRSVLDIACGLNPLSFFLLGLPDIELLALDAGSDVAQTLNRFFTASGMAHARAEAGDAMVCLSRHHYDMALVMKFLPLCERMEKGGAQKLMDSIDAAHIIASFPTRSLSGRNVGMEKNYSEWFEGLGFQGEIAERFVCGDEVFYVIKK